MFTYLLLYNVGIYTHMYVYIFSFLSSTKLFAWILLYRTDIPLGKKIVNQTTLSNKRKKATRKKMCQSSCIVACLQNLHM